jgi:DNA-binding MarR family transcriptional regulator
LASADRQTRLLDVLGKVVRALSRLSGGQEDGSLTATQRLALFETQAREPIRLTELADLLGVSPPTASRAVDALVEHGFVTRVPDPADRRAVLLTLTHSGRARVELRKAEVLKAFLPAAATMPAADQERLIALLAELAAALSEPPAR